MVSSQSLPRSCCKSSSRNSLARWMGFSSAVRSAVPSGHGAPLGNAKCLDGGHQAEGHTDTTTITST
eukprot:6289855-Pyramimonas_sp.AAC.1